MYLEWNMDKLVRTVRLHDRISVLRQYESDCYSICLFLLQCEKMAHEAAKNALYHLITSDACFARDGSIRNELFRKEVAKCALQVKIRSMNVDRGD
ncbi:hypothetical protein SD70_24210 [Gordoniibacillus kamchatkensis]|uniref:Uncharacterized protein n=1 Tax=Gordoniibacillus kamchatkensis TaxID=1590651 RepID=A0ABR5ACN2_9BACL|nr:hypothetical protein SD70_24210 [Paenibacillus sp. VKM B-2647]